ncbi:MAG: AraC family transcriptional regulator [Desulfobacterales bacterium]|nr:AraC family transcriptional regulator [Desulfobacterales bacterium]
MAEKTLKETSHLWRAPDIGEIELLKAHYITHTFPRHTHDGYVIGVIEHGAEAFNYRGELHVATAGEIVVVNPGEVHTGHSHEEGGWIYRTLYPSIDLLQRIDKELPGDRGDYPVFPQPVISDRQTAELLRRMHATLEKSESALERQTIFTDALARFISRHAAPARELPDVGSEHGAVKTAREYIEDAYFENITLRQLADLVNLSPYYLTRVFKKTTGLPPHEYLTQVRISRAREMLKNGEPIVSAAMDAGFVDQSHFTRIFKKFVGVTPGQYSRGKRGARGA